MSEPTREEKLRTIKAARQLMENMMAQFVPDMREHRENLNYLMGRTASRTQETTEDPAEQARLQALFAEVKNSKETK